MERLVYVFIISGLCCGVFSQFRQLDSIRTASVSLNDFGVKLLTELNDKANGNLNIALAPYVVWSMLGIINEGARNRTEKQITSVLNVPKAAFKDVYRQFHANITSRAENVELILSNAIFLPETERERLNRDFTSVAQNYYGLDVQVQDFHQPEVALFSMNRYMASATRNKINRFFLPGDLMDVVVLLGSAFYFKGAWNLPFNTTKTSRELFYNENDQPIGYVNMMFQKGPFPYILINDLASLFVELPYGKADKMSMIVMLPKKGTSVSKVLRTLSEKKFTDILYLLEKAGQDYSDEDVQVFLPKFKITSDLILNEVLHNLGIRDLFNSQDADLTAMVNNYLYVSKLIQKAIIEVDEEGTVAAAVAGASFINKTPPPNFRADRPFVFFIVDKPTKSILFNGVYTNPTQV